MDRIEGILEEPLLIDIDSNVAKAVAKMLESGRQEAVVMENGSFFGVLSAGMLVKMGIQTPEKTGIRPFVKQVQLMHFGSEPGEIINAMILNNFHCIPVQKESEVFFVTKLGLLKLMRKDLDLKGKTVDDVMNFPFSVDTGDSIATARARMRDMRVSRLVMIDSKDKVEGIIDMMTMLKTIIEKHRSSRTWDGGEKIKLDDLPVKFMASHDYVSVASGTQLAEALDRMISRGVTTIIVEDDGKLTGMVTPKDILKLGSQAVEGFSIAISGMHDEDQFVKSKVNEEVGRSLIKMDKMMPVDQFVMHLRKYHESGKTVKYSLHARLMTSKGDFYAEDYAWDLTKAATSVMSMLEKEVIKKHEKSGDAAGSKKSRSS